MAKTADLLAEIAINRTPLTAAELQAMGITKTTIKRLLDDGRLSKPMPGIYRVQTEDENLNFIWACVSRNYPGSVVAMMTAAVHHGLTEAMGGKNTFFVSHDFRPVEGWRVDGGAEFIRTRSERDLALGVQSIRIENVEVSITGPERTLVDMFRYSTYVDRSGSSPYAVDPEAIQDVVARYVDHPSLDCDEKVLRHIAKQYGVWDQLSLMLQTTQYSGDRKVVR